jgi:S1-C subfamily serine protease
MLGSRVTQFALLTALSASGAAAAEWTSQGSTATVDYYLDVSTMRKDGDLRRVWQLQDMKVTSRSGARSLRALSEYDCRQERYRVLQLDTFSGQMATGSLLATDTSLGAWSFIAPGTPFAHTLKFVCAPAGETASGGRGSDPPISAALLEGLPGPMIFAMVKDTIAVVHTDAGRQGSAVAMASMEGKGTAFATNCHVLVGASRIAVRNRHGEQPAVLASGRPEYDTCVLVSTLPAAGVRTFNAIDLMVGEKVYVVGAPQGLELSISEGIVSGKRGDPFFTPPLLIQTTAAISPGSSGGGLFDARGRLVGITTFKIREGESLNFAVSIHTFNAAMSEPTIRSLEDLNRDQKRSSSKSQ